jgi:hypothetical protein
LGLEEAPSNANQPLSIMITNAALVAAVASVLIAAALYGAMVLRRIYTDERRRIAAGKG